MTSARRIVFATTGSLGDLHPFLALGIELQRRGHRAAVATTLRHERTVREAGLDFFRMRPDPDDTPAFHTRYMHPKTGGEFVYRHYLAPAVRDSYADLMEAIAGADLLVSQSLMALAAPLAAAKTGIPWISAVLQPMSFFSVHDRPTYLPLAPLSWLCGRSPELHRKVLHYVKKHTLDWLQPVTEMSRELGLAEPFPHPLYEGQHSPDCVLAMFSPLLGWPREDWPLNTVQTGTAVYGEPDRPMPAALPAFLARSDKPLAVFTLSSAASNDAGHFYRDALAASRALNLRALLIMGGLSSKTSLPEPLPPDACRIDYVPFETVFPHAALIVHSGGVATSFKALQAGKPQVIVPHAHDQCDNALRLARLGVANVVMHRSFRAMAMRRAMNDALADAALGRRAEAISVQACAEDGVVLACDVIERRLSAVRQDRRQAVLPAACTAEGRHHA